MVLPEGVDMWYDDDPTYDGRHLRSLKRQTTDLMNEFEQAHNRATISLHRTDKNKANELRAELGLKKNRFQEEKLKEEMKTLITRVQSCLYRLRIFPEQLAITDGRDNLLPPIQQLTDTSNPIRVLVLNTQTNPGTITIPSIPNRPWHPPLAIAQSSPSDAPSADGQLVVRNRTTSTNQPKPTQNPPVSEDRNNA
ncbi:MAG: hypothetical protein VX367_07270 [SAR324 cluster bacterium]|nr:hypothetical protein [SAR324 cluster bacterium]